MVLRYSAVAEYFFANWKSAVVLKGKWIRRLEGKQFFYWGKHIAWLLWQCIFCISIVEDSVPITTLHHAPQLIYQCLYAGVLHSLENLDSSLSLVFGYCYMYVYVCHIKISCVAQWITKRCAASHWIIYINSTSQRFMVSRWIMEEHITDESDTIVSQTTEAFRKVCYFGTR